MRFNADLLDVSNQSADPHDLYASLNAHGLYNSRRYILRLSPKVHQKLSEFPAGIAISDHVDFEGAQAMSTLLHETVHWWQHIGTTTGLMLSLIYPAQAHANHNHLLKILQKVGPVKSLRQFSEQISSNKDPESPEGLATIVVNNQCDLEFFGVLITNPEQVKAIVEDPYFVSMGHAYQITYGNVLAVLSSTFDPDCRFLPDPRTWEPEFAALRDSKVEGFYYRSPIGISPIGTYHIFEGQARFAQLQFLYFASGGRLSWEDVRSLGMLGGVYGVAFEHFLKWAELDWPASIDSSTVGLFLLVCDVASNPSEGFPLPLVSPQRFMKDIDPGMRFIFLCRAIAIACRDVAGLVKNYSRDEYEEVSERLTSALRLFSPLSACREVERWSKEGTGFRELLVRHRAYSASPANVPIQVLFGHSIAFSIDKLKNPEIFCWPGAWCAGERCRPEVIEVFARHSARFIDKADDETIYPALPSGVEERTVVDTFHAFYAAHVVYELTRQWIRFPGPFRYDYRWLQPRGTDDEHKTWANTNFEQIFGVAPGNFILL